jgi:hypothetical protein
MPGQPSSGQSAAHRADPCVSYFVTQANPTNSATKKTLAASEIHPDIENSPSFQFPLTF